MCGLDSLVVCREKILGDDNRTVLAWLSTEGEALGDGTTMLEVAVVLTDTDLREVGSYQSIVRASPSTFAALLEDSGLAATYRNNGLLNQLEQAGDSAMTSEHIETEILDMLAVFGDDTRVVPVLGSAKDLPLLSSTMPRLVSRFDTEPISASSVTRLYEFATGDTGSGATMQTTHRAMANVRAMIVGAVRAWDMFQSYSSRNWEPGLAATDSERVLAGISLVQAALSSHTTGLTSVLEELSARDVIAGVTATAVELLRQLSAKTQTEPMLLLNKMRLTALN
jgi:oligoribonuclease (3'-5' exoribonuclease)